MSWHVWLLFVVTETALCFTPGPAVLLVVSTAMSHGFRPGVKSSLGILTANALYFFLSALGVGAVLVASTRLFLALKWLGAGYLIYLGLKMLVSREAVMFQAEDDVRQAPRPPRGGFYLRGLVVQGASPKALIFFTALLPQFIDAQSAVGLQVAILGVTSVLIEVCVLVLYSALAVRARRLAGSRYADLFERLGGGFLIAAGARLAALTRP